LERKKARKRYGRIVFFIPTLVVLAVAAFGIISFISIQTGTIVVEAMSSGRYTTSVQLHPYVSVGGKTEQSPFNLTLPQGQYTVEFGQLSWYLTPGTRSVVVSGGKTQFAVAVYDPVVRVISISSAGFNSTSTTAEHGLTPVIWVNLSKEVFTLSIQGLAKIPLNPGENYTAVFPSQGTFSYSIPNYDGNVNSE
jgi:hypothetical protein